MLRLFGIILFSGTAAVYGIYLSMRISTGARQRKALISLMYAIKSGIQFGSSILSDVYGSFSDDTLEKAGFMKILRSGKPQALKDALGCKGLMLSKDVLCNLTEFSKKLGHSGFAENEELMCSRYIAMLEEEDRKLCVQEKVREDLCRRLGLLSGLFAALILI